MNKRGNSWMGGAFLLIILIITYSLLPIGVDAQSTPLKLKTLTVSLWPEYDRPDVLVIHRVELSADTPLPTELTFRLPGYIETMHAVAIEENGSLISVDPSAIELTPQGDELLLTFPTRSPAVHFEYYDPVILTKQNDNRTLNYNLSIPYPVEAATFEVQQPQQVQDFSLTPEAVDTRVDNNGFQYSLIHVPNLAPNQSFEVVATYQRSTDQVSSLENQPQIQQPAVTVSIPESSTETTPYLGYIFIGSGVVLLLGVGGYFWLKTRDTTTQRKRRPGRTKRQRATKPQTKPKRPPVARPSASSAFIFCYRCGAALGADANFCHKCGAERRKA